MDEMNKPGGKERMSEKRREKRVRGCPNPMLDEKTLKRSTPPRLARLLIDGPYQYNRHKEKQITADHIPASSDDPPTKLRA